MRMAGIVNRGEDKQRQFDSFIACLHKHKGSCFAIGPVVLLSICLQDRMEGQSMIKETFYRLGIGGRLSTTGNL